MYPRQVELIVDGLYGTTSLHPALKVGSSTWLASPGLVTLLIGILTSPPRYSGLSLSNFWAQLRYLPALSRQVPELRLRRLWGDTDSHQKTLLSDDFGMGLPALYISGYADAVLQQEATPPKPGEFLQNRFPLTISSSASDNLLRARSDSNRIGVARP